MAKFVRVHNQYINLDHYTSIKILDEHTMRVEDKEGRAYQIHLDGVEDIEQALKPVIPATNTWAWVIWTNLETTLIVQQPIIGWRDHYGFAEPIFRQELDQGSEFAFMETPEGKYIGLEYDGGIFNNFQEIGEHVRASVKQQQEWKHEREKRAKKAK